MAVLWVPHGRYYLYTHFMGKETKAQELSTLLGVTLLINVEWDSEPDCLAL